MKKGGDYELTVNMDETFEHFAWRADPQPAPLAEFTGPNGETLTLEAFRGKVVVMNFWATWCGPCRHEMPSLDRLQTLVDPDRVKVLALSNDRGGPEKVLPFFDGEGITNLTPYYEDLLSVSRAFGIQGYPTTLIIDSEGRELGRPAMPAFWDNEAALKLVNRALEAQRVGTGASPE